MSSRAILERERLNRRIRAMGESRPSRDYPWDANNHGPNTDHFLCPVCLCFTAEARRCCGTDTTPITYRARVPRRNANTRQRRAFYRRFALPAVEHYVRVSFAKGEVPDPAWLAFVERGAVGSSCRPERSRHLRRRCRGRFHFPSRIAMCERR